LLFFGLIAKWDNRKQKTFFLNLVAYKQNGTIGSKKQFVFFAHKVNGKIGSKNHYQFSLRSKTGNFKRKTFFLLRSETRKIAKE
jgi:hypothetical protein